MLVPGKAKFFPFVSIQSTVKKAIPSITVVHKLLM